MKLVMTLLVKNEADIIENNIRFHAAQGVDAFLVMDNNSDDKTPEILARLAKEFDVTVIHNPSMEYQQAQWMTSLANTARKNLKADLVISNDADEFWSCRDGSSLKSKLSLKDSVVTVGRYNYILNQGADGLNDYVFCKNRIINPITYQVDNYQTQKNIILPLQKISPKVIVNPRGLRTIKGGNHRAKSFYFWRDRFCPDIIVDHYPIRSFQQFDANIQNRKRIMDKYPEKKMSPHYRRWLASLAAGELRQEYEQMLVNDVERDVLLRLGVLEDLAISPLQGWYQSVYGAGAQ